MFVLLDQVSLVTIEPKHGLNGVKLSRPPTALPISLYTNKLILLFFSIFKCSILEHFLFPIAATFLLYSGNPLSACPPLF